MSKDQVFDELMTQIAIRDLTIRERDRRIGELMLELSTALENLSAEQSRRLHLQEEIDRLTHTVRGMSNRLLEEQGNADRLRRKTASIEEVVSDLRKMLECSTVWDESVPPPVPPKAEVE